MMYDTRSGCDPPLIVWISLTVCSKYGASLTFCSGVIVCQSKNQRQVFSENFMYYRMLTVSEAATTMRIRGIAAGHGTF